MTKAFLIPYTFTLLNWAAVVGLFHFLQGTAVVDIWSEQPGEYVPGKQQGLG